MAIKKPRHVPAAPHHVKHLCHLRAPANYFFSRCLCEFGNLRKPPALERFPCPPPPPPRVLSPVPRVAVDARWPQPCQSHRPLRFGPCKVGGLRTSLPHGPDWGRGTPHTPDEVPDGAVRGGSATGDICTLPRSCLAPSPGSCRDEDGN